MWDYFKKKQQRQRLSDMLEHGSKMDQVRLIAGMTYQSDKPGLERVLRKINGWSEKQAEEFLKQVKQKGKDSGLW